MRKFSLGMDVVRTVTVNENYANQIVHLDEHFKAFNSIWRMTRTMATVKVKKNYHARINFAESHNS